MGNEIPQGIKIMLCRRSGGKKKKADGYESGKGNNRQ
jgi:hypothetical protein